MSDKSTKKKDAFECVVGPVRISFPHIKEPGEPDDFDNRYHSGTFLFPHDDQLTEAARKAAAKSLERLEDTIQKAAKSFFGDDIPKGIRKKELALKNGYPLADQDEKADKLEGYQDGYLYFTAKSKNPVGVVQGNKNMPGHGKLIDKDDLDDFIFPGAWVMVQVRCYNTNKKGDAKRVTGVGLGLQALQFLKVDERLGGGMVDAEEVDFGDELDDDDFFGGDDGEDLLGED